MKVAIVCIGRLGGTPEAALAEDWIKRAGLIGRSHGLRPVEIIEVEAQRRGKSAEGQALLRRAGGSFIIACDEHGASMSSRAFAERLGALRDGGVSRLAFLIGGAEGLDAEVLTRAEEHLAFGAQTWPHALARAMLAEQLFRAASLMGGHPYHRE